MTTTMTTTTTARGSDNRWIEIPPSWPAHPSGNRGKTCTESITEKTCRVKENAPRPCAQGRPHLQEAGCRSLSVMGRGR